MLCRLGNKEGRIHLCMINNRHRFADYVKSTVAWLLSVESVDGGLTVYDFWGFTAVPLTISKVMVFTIMVKQPWLRKCFDTRLRRANTCPGIRKQIPSSFYMFIDYTPGSCWWGRHSVGAGEDSLPSLCKLWYHGCESEQDRHEQQILSSSF